LNHGVTYTQYAFKTIINNLFNKINLLNTQLFAKYFYQALKNIYLIANAFLNILNGFVRLRLLLIKKGSNICNGVNGIDNKPIFSFGIPSSISFKKLICSLENVNFEKSKGF
jgi:hypothetical protein